MPDTHVTIVGNIAGDVQIRYLNSGKGVLEVSVAVNERKKEGDRWVDGEASFYDCTLWDQMAENAAESLQKGNRVIVVGVLKQDKWTTDGGEKRSKVKIQVDSIGPDLRWATASVVRNERQSGNGGQAAPSQSSLPASPFK